MFRNTVYDSALLSYSLWRISERRQAGDICLFAWVHYFLSSAPSHFTSLPPTFTKCRKQIYLLHHDASLPLSVLSLSWNWQEINTTLIYPPFFLHVLLPLPAVKCPFWTEHKHQHNIMPYQSRHKDPWAHCLSVSASSSFSALSASAKPPKNIHDHKQDNRMKTGVATKIILGQNASLIIAAVNYRVLWE